MEQSLAWNSNVSSYKIAAVVQLCTLGMLCLGLEWQVGNPLVLHLDIFNDDLASLLLSRFKRADSLLKLCDVALVESVLRAPA